MTLVYAYVYMCVYLYKRERELIVHRYREVKIYLPTHSALFWSVAARPSYYY